MTKYLDENGLLYLWGKLKLTFLHNVSSGTFTGVTSNATTGLRSFNVPTTAEHIKYDNNTTLKSKIDTIVSQGGEPNTINSISLNGANISPDNNKNVDISITGNDIKVEPPTEVGGEPYDEEYSYISGGDTIRNALVKLDTAIYNKTDTDTKNTAGATNVVYGNGEVLYYIGAKELTANPQTYSESNLYSTKTGQLYGNFAGVHFVKLNESNTSTSWAINVNEILGTKTVDIVSPATLGLYAGTTLGLDAPTINVTQLSEVNLVGGDFSQIVAGNTDLQSALNAKAPLASPALTGTPTAPTAAAGTNTTQIATTSFVNTAITNALGNFTGVSYEVVQALPASGAAGTIYLISNSGTNPNIYDEYIYVNNGFEKIGTTDVDLTNYWSKTELVVIPNTTIDYIVTNHALPS